MKLNKKIIIHRKHHIVEYDIITVLKRLFIISFFIFILYSLFFNNNSSQNNNYSYDLFIEEDISSINSRQDFISLDKDVFVQGNSNIFFEDKFNLIKLNNFKINNNKNLHIYLATNEKGSNRIYIDKLNANIGKFEFIINKSIHIKTHNTLIIWNSLENKPWAYSYIQ